MEKEEYNGQMVKYMMEITKMIKNMVTVLSVGQMEGNMMVITRMVKRKDWGLTTGPMEECMRATGKMVSNMVKVSLQTVKG